MAEWREEVGVHNKDDNDDDEEEEEKEYEERCSLQNLRHSTER